MNKEAITKLLQPKSIAVVGASAQPGKIGYTVIENLIKGGYKGKIYPVNPTATEILNLKVYPSVSAMPDTVDLAVVTVPVKFVAQVAEECGQKGIKAMSVITSGFSEVGRRDLEDQLLEITHRYGICVLGPNIVGTLSNSDALNASFAPFLPFVGKATLITQSGALLIAMDAITYTRKVGFDKMISIEHLLHLSLYRRFQGWTEIHRGMPEDQQTDHRSKGGGLSAWSSGSGFAHWFTGRCGKGVWRSFPAGRCGTGLRSEQPVRPHAGSFASTPIER